jgi:hypothetical protein
MTILSASSGNGRCIAFASSHGARIQTSRSSSIARITGIVFGKGVVNLSAQLFMSRPATCLRDLR